MEHAIRIITVSNFRGRKVKDSLVQHILKDKKQSCVNDDDDDLPCDNETQKPLQSPTVVSALRSRSISVREGRCRFAEFIGRRRRRSAEGMGSFGGNSRGFIRLRVCVYFLHAHQSADPILMLLLLLLLLLFLRGCHFNIFLLISLLHWRGRSDGTRRGWGTMMMIKTMRQVEMLRRRSCVYLLFL